MLWSVLLDIKLLVVHFTYAKTFRFLTAKQLIRAGTWRKILFVTANFSFLNTAAKTLFTVRLESSLKEYSLLVVARSVI